jgi:hypothetical protein
LNNALPTQYIYLSGTVHFDPDRVDSEVDSLNPLQIRARSGFLWGADALDNPEEDPAVLSHESSTTWPSSSFTPTELTVAEVRLSKPGDTVVDRWTTEYSATVTFDYRHETPELFPISNLSFSTTMPTWLIYKSLSASANGTVHTIPDSTTEPQVAPNNSVSVSYYSTPDAQENDSGNDISLTLYFEIATHNTDGEELYNEGAGSR